MATSVFPSNNSSSKFRLPAILPTAFDNHIETVCGSLPYPDECKVFVKGLKKKTSPASVLTAFLPYGPVLLVKVPFSHITLKNMGHGYVVFKEAQIARNLVESVGSLTIEGKTVILSGYDFRQKKSYKEKCKPKKVPGASVGDTTHNKLCSGSPSNSQPMSQACVTSEEIYASVLRTKTSSRESFVKVQCVDRQVRPALGLGRDLQSLLRLKPTASAYHALPAGLDQRCKVHNIRFNLCSLQYSFLPPIQSVADSQQPARSAASQSRVPTSAPLNNMQ